MTRQQALPSLSSAIERDTLDFNRTPAWCVQLLVPHLGQPRTVLEVGCGDGAIGRVLRQSWPEACIVGADIHQERRMLAFEARCYDLVCGGDWTADPWDASNTPVGACDLIISNPPFGLPALRFLERALERVAPGGTVAFLLPTHWDHDPDVESAYARQRFLDGLRMPDGREGYCKLAIVGGGPYPARPSFKKGGTASDRYAWFMFGSRWAGQPSRRLHAIPPADESGQLSMVAQ